MGNAMFWKKSNDADSAWKQQNKAQGENIVYRYINLQRTGKLVDVYIDDGPEAVEQLIITELEPLLYNNGKGKWIRKIDFIRWKNKCEAQEKGTQLVDTRPENQVLKDQGDQFRDFEDREMCWDLDQRGAVGETAFHMCVLHDTPIHAHIAKILLRLYPKLALDCYESEEYYGESALHLAIVYGDFEMVKLLVENGAIVNQRATGRFFLPEDQKKGRTKVTSYEGYAYYGEYPLAFAACFGHEEIYDYLIDHGADPNLQDAFGNNVLHMMVISNQINMYSYAMKHHIRKADMTLQNGAQLTPLTLASKLGRHEIFKEIIELQSYEIWRYSNITCSTYPLEALDTISPTGKTNWSSALTYITEGDKEEHLDMLGGGVIKQLLDEKWKTFARRRFIERLVLAVLHLLTLSLAIYTRPDYGSDLLGPTDTTNIVRYVAEIIVCCDCVTNLIFQLEEIRSQGFIGFLKNQASAPAKFIFNISCVLILACVPLRLLSLPNLENVLLAAAAPCAWAFLLFFARGITLLGPFVIMIYKMCASDMLRFVIIFVIFLVQFSQANDKQYSESILEGFPLSGVFVTVFYQMLRGDLYRFGIIYCIFLLGFVPGFYFLFKGIENENIQTFKTIEGTVMQLFQMTLGEFKMSKGELSVQYEDFEQTRIPILTKAVFGVFAILVPILLLNMLIAMMGNTYQLIISRSEKEWRRQWAKIIIVLERTFSRKQLLRFQQEYSVSMANDIPGLMVIKESRKTKARQRKGAISNWKRLVHEIKVLIKEQKRAGKSGLIDLTSEEITERVTERQLRKRRSMMQRARSTEDPDDANADGLISAFAQLAWEKDIDFSKGKSFVKPGSPGTIQEEAEAESSTNSSTGDRTPLLRSTEGLKTAAMGYDNPILVSDDLTGKASSKKDLEMKQLNNNKDSNSKSVSTILRSPKVAPVKMTPKSQQEKTDSKSKKTSNKKPPPPPPRPPSARSSSGGSKESKDSAFSEERDRTRRVNLAVSGSRSSLNSASSLSSLLHAWDSKTKDSPDPTSEF